MAKLALIASSGGHLYQLFSLKNFWENKEHFWVSFDTQDAEYLLKNEKVYWAYYPTNRNIKNLFRNLILSFRLLRRERPDAVISTGAGVCVPFIIMARFMGIKTLYLESITRNQELSLSAKIVYPFVDKLLVQWPELSVKFKKAEYKGRII